jgi:hypothetical protein
VGDVVSFNIERAVREDDNTLLSPADCLEDALREVKSGERECDGLLILTLDRSEGRFCIGNYACNVKSSEMLAMMEVFKSVALTDMGYIPE